MISVPKDFLIKCRSLRFVEEKQFWDKRKKTKEAFKAITLESDMIIPDKLRNCSIEGTMIGPSKTAYEGLVLRFCIDIPAGYPLVRPRLHFITRVHHPNVGAFGAIDIYGGDGWESSATLTEIMEKAYELLKTPRTGRTEASNDEAANQFKRCGHSGAFAEIVKKYAEHEYQGDHHTFPDKIKLTAE